MRLALKQNKKINEKLDDIRKTEIVLWEGKKTQKYHYKNRKRKTAARFRELTTKKRKIIILKKGVFIIYLILLTF